MAAPQKAKGVMLGPITAKRVLHLTATSDGVYAPSEVKRYSGTADEEGTTGGDPGADGTVVFVSFLLTTDLTTTGSATIQTTSHASEAVGASISLSNTTGETAKSGAEGTAVKLNSIWHVIEVNRPAAFLHVTLSCNSHDWTAGDSARGFDADQVTPITVSFTKDIERYPVDFRATVTISNPYNFNWKSGDRALLRKEDDTGNYFVVKVFRVTCLRFRFVLTANAPTGLTPNLTATAICPTNSEDGPPPSGSLTVKDIYGIALNARSGQKGVAEYDYNNDWWYATECQHNAWRFRGTLNGSLSGGASFFSVNPVVSFGGVLPSGPLNVYNMHSWDAGTNGYIVSCEWNPVDGRYEAYQMRCPA